MIVERMTAEHFDAVVEMGHRFMAASGYDKIAKDDLKSTLPSLAGALVGNERSTLLVAVDDGKPVGMAGVAVVPLFFAPETHVAQELFWWVNEESRNGGAGKALLVAVEEWARAQGVAALSVSSLAIGQEKVAAMYAKAGFRPVEASYVKELPDASV